MTLLPIVERELRVASRKWGTYLLRISCAAAAIAIATFVFFGTSLYSSPAQTGSQMFLVEAWFLFVFALSMGIRVTSDSISVEKRDGTLGLLFLTDLRGYDVVLGKFTAHSLGAIYGLVATLPVLAIPVLLGGVTMKLFLLTVLVLFNTLFFSLAAGMFASSLIRKERAGSSLTFLLVALVVLLIPLLGVLIEEYFGFDFGEVLWAMSPGYAMASLSGQLASPMMGGGRGPGFPYVSVGFIHGIAWLFLILATIITPRGWQKGEGRSRRVTRAGGMTAGPSADDPATRRRQRMLDRAATHWLSARSRKPVVTAWVFVFGMLGIWLWMWAEFRNDVFHPALVMVCFFIASAVLKLLIASEAVRITQEGQREGALELVLCSPVGVGEILRGYLLSLRTIYLGPALFLWCWFVLALGLGISFELREYGNDLGEILSTAFVLLLTCALDLCTLAVFGLWRGLTAKNFRAGFTEAVGRVLVFPWVIVLVVMLGTAILRMYFFDEFAVALVCWSGLMLGWGAFLLRTAWVRLNRDFRAVAASRYDPNAVQGFWAKLGRAWGRATARAASK